MDWLMGKNKPKKPTENVKQPWLEQPNIDAKIFKCRWKEVCQTPPGVPITEWLAANTRPFFHNLSQVYASLADFCTVSTCPTMMAGPKTEYQWVDEKGKKIKGLSAPQYIDYVLSYCQATLDDEATFPTRLDMAFPRDFMATCRKMYRLLLHVFAHLYHHHFSTLLQLGLVPHLNTLYTHFVFFVNEHSLVDPKEMVPMAEMSKYLLEAK